MGDGGAERDRGPARRESRGGRGGDRGGAEDSGADAGRRSPREIAGTSASSPAGSRESGDSDGQPGLGEADHCRRILVRGKRTVLGSGPPDPHPSPSAASTSQFTQTAGHQSVIHSANTILSFYCVLNTELSAGDKAANGTKEMSVSPPYSSQPLGPAAHPRPIPAGYGGGDRDTSAGCGQPGPRPASLTAGAEKSVTRAPRGQDEEGPASGTAGGKGRRSAQRPGRFPAACPASFPVPGDADRTGCSRERASGRGGRRAALARLGFALSARASSRRLGPAGSRCGLPPAWPFASLPFSLALRPPLFFPGFSLRRALLPSPLFLQALLDCARVPSSAWSPRREADPQSHPHAKL